MSKPAAISASLVDVRNIAAHKCVRLEIHVPVEQASLVMAAFGWPTAADPVPVAIARLDLSKPSGAAPIEPEKVRTPFRDLPPAQQAAMRCNEPEFWKFIDGVNSDHAANILRRKLGIESRSQLNTNPLAAARWAALDTEYFAWQRGAR
jgi:hypothetical protein